MPLPHLVRGPPVLKPPPPDGGPAAADLPFHPLHPLLRPPVTTGILATPHSRSPAAGALRGRSTVRVRGGDVGDGRLLVCCLWQLSVSTVCHRRRTNHHLFDIPSWFTFVPWPCHRPQQKLIKKFQQNMEELIESLRRDLYLVDVPFLHGLESVRRK
jgi:hypothetical protein